MNDLDVVNSSFWRLFPHSFAEHASDGRWLPYRHVVEMSEVIATAVAQGNGRIIVDCPPRSGKSELISYWFLVWFLDMFPQRKIILTSYEAGLAEEFGRKVRNEMDTNPCVRTKLRQDSTAAKRFHTDQGGGMVTAGVGGPITGKGFHVGIIDDPIKNWEEAESELKREKIKKWFESTFYTRKEPGASIIVVATRWNEDDLSGWLLREHSDDWKLIHMPAISEDPARAELPDYLGRPEGVALCPERYDLEELLKIKKGVGSRVWNALYQGSPSPGEGSHWKRKFWRRWTELPVKLDEVIQSWDLTFTGKSTSDYVVGQVWGRKGSQKFLIDQVRGQWTITQTIDQILRLSSKYPDARRKLIENKANGPAVEELLKDKVSGLLLVEPEGGKVTRATACEPTLEAGDVYLPADEKAYPWIPEFIEECAKFPHGKNDDMLDTASQAINYFEGKANNLLEKLALWE